MKEIKETIKLLDIDSNVKIDLDRIEDKISESLKNKLLIDSSAKVLDYKITDGTEIGVLLELSDGSKNWFFSHEVYSIKNGIKVQRALAKQTNVSTKTLYSGKSLAYIFNPINFTKWLIAVSSDIV